MEYLTARQQKVAITESLGNTASLMKYSLAKSYCRVACGDQFIHPIHTPLGDIAEHICWISFFMPITTKYIQHSQHHHTHLINYAYKKSVNCVSDIERRMTADTLKENGEIRSIISG